MKFSATSGYLYAETNDTVIGKTMVGGFYGSTSDYQLAEFVAAALNKAVEQNPTDPLSVRF